MKSYVRRSCTIKCSDISSLDHIAVWFGKISDKKWQVFAFWVMKKTYEKKTSSIPTKRFTSDCKSFLSFIFLLYKYRKNERLILNYISIYRKYCGHFHFSFHYIAYMQYIFFILRYGGVHLVFTS